jgi:hypothetical protein
LKQIERLLDRDPPIRALSTMALDPFGHFVIQRLGGRQIGRAPARRQRAFDRIAALPAPSSTEDQYRGVLSPH